MKSYIDFLSDIKEWQELVAEKQANKLTHSYMLLSKDKVLLDIFSKGLSALILCKHGICGECSDCQKVFDGVHPDVFVYPKDESIKKDDIADIRDHIGYKPFEADGKVFLLDKFSSANEVSQNKLLKSLENPPEKTYFILNVDNEIPVLPTIFSRCKKIYLPILNEKSIEKYLRLMGITQDISKITYVAEGRLDKALNFANNVAYSQNYDLVVDVLLNLNKSANMLKFTSKLYQKAGFLEDILEIMESILADTLYVRLNKPELITNKNIKDKITKIAEKYSADAIDLIIKKIFEIRKQIDFNCTRNGLIDSLLLYMLEVKYLCK